MLQTHTPPEPDFFAYLHGSHRHLERAGTKLVEAIAANDREETLLLWRDLEAQLLAHMEAEERYVLPAFAKADPGEALALLREHGKLREQLLELGVAVELHTLRQHMLDDFVALLRAHATREESLLYTWAAALLDDRLAGPARRHIEKVLR
jgi:hemerythrin superfamily protein